MGNQEHLAIPPSIVQDRWYLFLNTTKNSIIWKLELVKVFFRSVLAFILLFAVKDLLYL
jgi:hypothetical protein